MRRAVTLFRAGLILLIVSTALLVCPNLLTPGRALSSAPVPAEPQAAGETNLSLGKPATQSSTGWDSPASRAVDGNTDGNWYNGSVSHTDSNAQAWWQVDLGSPQQVGRVDIYLMTICCSSHQNFDVKVSTDGSNWQSFYVTGPVDHVSVPVNLQARHVRIQLRDTNYLALAEVRVFGAGTQPPAAQTHTPPHALSLNGTSAYVSVPYSSSLDINGPITVEAWVKRNPAGATQAIVERYGANDGGYAVRIESDRLCFYTLNNNHDFHRLVSNSVVTTGVWHHVAAVYDGGQKQIFIDGVLDTSAVTSFGPGVGTANLRIGVVGDANVYFFGGLIDEVRVTAGVRYASSFIPDLSQAADGSDTRGLWNFNTQTAHDSSGNNNHGTFVGSAYCSATCPAGEKYSEWKAAQAQAQAADESVVINFDNFAHGTIITNQYGKAVFSTSPGQLPVVYNPRSNPNEYAVALSPPNVLTRVDNFFPNQWNHFAPLTVDFPRPVNNLIFGVSAIDAIYGHVIFELDIYQKNVYKETRVIRSLGSGVNMVVNVGQPAYQFGHNEVTKIVIKNLTFNGFARDPYGLEFDDFTFTVPEALKVNLTNPRVSGNIQNTVKPALLGADVKTPGGAEQDRGHVHVDRRRPAPARQHVGRPGGNP